MKVLKFIGHPVVVITVFLLIMISGEAFGGPYLLYLILGAPHGAAYSLTAIAGIALLCLTLTKLKIKFISFILTFAGIVLLFCSIVLFFQGDRLRYNEDSFVQTVPKFTMVLFGFCTLCSLLLRSLQWAGFPRNNSVNA